MKNPQNDQKLRGYGQEHQRLRRRWAREVDAGLVNCAFCGQLIVPGTPWDLGHLDGDRSKYAGPEHATCNRAVWKRNRRGSRKW
jgi:hypothetical protein